MAWSVTLRKSGTHTLITCCSIQHAEDLQDVAVAVIAMEFVARPIKTQHNLSRLPMG
jgi:hypothetical protein